MNVTSTNYNMLADAQGTAPQTIRVTEHPRLGVTVLDESSRHQFTAPMKYSPSIHKMLDALVRCNYAASVAFGQLQSTYPHL